MRSGSRQKTLVVLFSALLLAAAWRFGRPGPGMDRLAPGSPAAGSARVAPLSAHGGDRVATLLVARLDGFRPWASAGRDPFRFDDPPVRQPTPEPAASLPLREIPAASPGLPVRTPPEFPMAYLGRFGPPDKKIAVFSAGAQVFNALEGEVLAGGFVISRIGYESVEIRFLDFPEWPAKRVAVQHR